jgi:DNA-binding GntR family transcriptional regulator
MPRLEALSKLIARQIVELAIAEGWTTGRHLPEVALAKHFNVSRSPVHEALEELTRIGALKWQPNRGFFLHIAGADLAAAGQELVDSGADTPYLQIAADRLAGDLPEQVTETLLQRRYGLSRVEVVKILARMAQEGWIARRPGYGWSFLPVLTSLEAHNQSFRFRMAIEPAALLEPTFRIDRTAFARSREQQRELVAGRIGELTSAELFEVGSDLHETVVRCSNNPFFIDALVRVNRLRRLIEYRAMIDTTLFLDQAREHLLLLDLIEGGDRRGAADLLRRHLDAVRAVKIRILESDPPKPRSETEEANEDDLVALMHF